MINKTVDYDAVLVDLEAKRDELDAAISAIKRLVAGGAATNGARRTSAAGVVDIRKDDFFGLSAVDAAKKYLHMCKTSQSTKAIAIAIQKGGFHTAAKNVYSNVYTSLSRGEHFVKVGKGLWGLKEWYKGRTLPKQGKAEKNGGNEAKMQQNTKE